MSKPRRAAEPSWRWHAWVVATTVLVGLALGKLASATGADEAVKRATTRFYGPLLTSFYPARGQQAITILTIDDDDLDSLDFSWPLDLDYYQRLLDHLIAARPKAIFLDLMFLDRKRPADIGHLLGAACRAATEGIPLFLATVTPAGKRGYTEAALFAGRVGDQPCIRPVAPHVSPDRFDQSQWHYVLQPKDQAFPSPALALYRALSGSEQPIDVRAPLALVWGTAPAESNVLTMIKRVDDPKPDGPQYEPLCRPRWGWWQVLPFARTLHDLVAQPLAPLCPYHRVMPVRAFQNQGFNEPQRREALRGKVVLIGTDLRGTGDSHVSPFHGALPGVHVHAMALDNLIAFDGRYKQERDPLWSEATGLHDLVGKGLAFNVFALLASSIAILCFRRLDRRARRTESPQPWHPDPADWAAFVALFPSMVLFGRPRVRRRGDFRRLVLKLGSYLLVAGAIVWVGYHALQRGPLAVVQYALFPLLADTVPAGERIAINLRDYLRAFWSEQPWRAWRRSGAKAD